MDNVTVGKADGHHSYKKTDKAKDGILYYDYTVPENTDVYLFFPNNYQRKVKLGVSTKSGGAGGSYTSKGTFGDSDTNCIIDLGESSTGNLHLKVTIDNTSNNFYVIPHDSYIYYVDMDTFRDAFTRLGQTQFIIDSESTDSHLFGTVTTSTEKQLMFTSIPYDEGWNIYVDGEKVEIYEANNSLIAFHVEGAGEHTIEMKYMPATIALGITISVTCLVVYILILIAYPFIKRIPFVRRLVLIEGEELPLLATPEYRAEITEGDIGAPDPGEPTSEELIAEASAAKYGKTRDTEALLNKKGKKKPQEKGKK